MTSPNAYTRQALTTVSSNVNASYAQIQEVLRHTQVVAESTTGPERSVAQEAARRTQRLYDLLQEAVREAETAKVCFRTVTLTWKASGDPQEPALKAM